MDKEEISVEENFKTLDNGILEGRDIDYFFTIKSWYDNDCIGVQVGNVRYRLPVKELLKIASHLKFEIVGYRRFRKSR